MPEPEPERDDGWSKPFHVGEVVLFKGVPMEIVRVKKLRKEIHLRFKEQERQPHTKGG